MNKKQVIEGIQLTDKVGAYLNDKISLILSPAQLESIIYEYERLALSTDDYGKQGEYRAIKDYLSQRYADWQQAREVEIPQSNCGEDTQEWGIKLIQKMHEDDAKARRDRGLV